MGLTNRRARSSCGLLSYDISPTANRKQNSDHPGLMERRLDPDIGRILPVLPLKDAANLTPKRARDELVALTDRRKDVPLPQPAVVVDTKVDGAAGSIPARMYRASTTATATVVFLHGGGWVAGDLYTHDRHLRALTLALDAVVLSVDYRRAPEAPFPAAFEDALAATQWAAKNIAQLGGDASRVAVAGDSAGGQLAASVALACRDGGPRLKALAIRALIVTRLRSRFASPGLSQTSPNRTLSVSSASLGAMSPINCCARVCRFSPCRVLLSAVVSAQSWTCRRALPKCLRCRS